MKTRVSAVYFTRAHKVDDCLRNGSFVRRYPDGKMVQYMNGVCMGIIEKMPKGMKEVPSDHAIRLLPKCCRP